MRKMMPVLVTTLLLATAACDGRAGVTGTAADGSTSAAATSIDGTWRADLASAQVIEKPRDGGHSGSWKPAKYDAIRDERLAFSFRLDGEMLSMSSPTGQSYTAGLDETDAPIKGDTGGTLVSVKRLSDNSFRETVKRDGRAVRVTTLSIADDGVMSAVSENKVRRSAIRFTANRR